MFNSAKSIVSPHGAALGNLVFCQKDTHLLELFNASHFHCLYWNFANILDLDYYYYQSNDNKIMPPHNKNQNIQLEPCILEKILLLTRKCNVYYNICFFNIIALMCALKTLMLYPLKKS